MSFEDMPDRGKFSLPGGQDYSDLAIELAREVVASTRNRIDVKYGDDFYQKLDVFLPDDESLTGLPVLLFLHGGAWRHGFKEWMGFMAPRFLNLPAIFVSANHRLAPETKYPKPLEDCFDALAWIHRSIAALGGDPNRIFVGGHSSGGYYAAMMALRPDYLVARGLPSDVIKACFPVSAPLNLHLDEVEPGGRRERLIKLFLERDEDDRDASPIDHVTGNTTPFLLAYGSDDLPELIVHNKQMIELLSDQPCVFEHHEFAGFTHFDTSQRCQDPDFLWVRKAREWMVETPSLAATSA